MLFDIGIIGAGAVGSLIARELARYELKIYIVEKGNDVACGATKANSAIIHGAFDPVPGTLKASLNARGIGLMEKAAKELDFISAAAWRDEMERLKAIAAAAGKK